MRRRCALAGLENMRCARDLDTGTGTKAGWDRLIVMAPVA
jgi:hypothetical protein